LSDHAVRKSISAYFAAVSMLDSAAFAGTFHEQGETSDPAGTPPHRGRAAIQAWFESLAGLFEEVSMEPSRVFLRQGHAAVLWSAQGTGRNGRQVMFAGITAFELDPEGEILRARGYWNPEPVIAELSLPPAATGR
jgi:steroid delta-isomerase